MFRSNIRLPFLVTSSEVTWQAGGDMNVYLELPIEGILRVEEGALCFQFIRKRSLGALASWNQTSTWMQYFGGGSKQEEEEPKSRVEEACVPVEQIMRIKLKRRRWFASRLTLEANDLRAFEHIPSSMGGTRINLRIRKEHADLADSFVSHLSLWLSEHTLRHLGGEVDEGDPAF